MFASDLRQVVSFSGYSDSSTNKTYHNDITELLLKMALNTITHTPTLIAKNKNSDHIYLMYFVYKLTYE